MITKERQAKIQRCYFTIQRVPRPSGKVDEYHQWQGWYREGGKRHRIWIGKDLPDELRQFATEASLRAAA